MLGTLGEQDLWSFCPWRFWKFILPLQENPFFFFWRTYLWAKEGEIGYKIQLEKRFWHYTWGPTVLPNIESLTFSNQLCSSYKVPSGSQGQPLPLGFWRMIYKGMSVTQHLGTLNPWLWPSGVTINVVMRPTKGWRTSPPNDLWKSLWDRKPWFYFWPWCSYLGSFTHLSLCVFTYGMKGLNLGLSQRTIWVSVSGWISYGKASYCSR